jgi:hypothetical protein
MLKYSIVLNCLEQYIALQVSVYHGDLKLSSKSDHVGFMEDNVTLGPVLS